MKRTLVIFLITCLTYAKDPVRVPGNLNIEDTLSAGSITLPEDTILSSTSAEITTLNADTLITSYLNSDTMLVSKLLSIHSAIRFNGKLNVTGTITYSSKVQIGIKKNKVLSFLQHPVSDWQQLDDYFITDSLILDDLPPHSYLNIVTSCHCESGSALLKVNGYIEWMDKCRGTSQVSSVVSHSDSSLDIKFDGCSSLSPLRIYFK